MKAAVGVNCGPFPTVAPFGARKRETERSPQSVRQHRESQATTTKTATMDGKGWYAGEADPVGCVIGDARLVVVSDRRRGRSVDSCSSWGYGANRDGMMGSGRGAERPVFVLVRATRWVRGGVVVSGSAVDLKNGRVSRARRVVEGDGWFGGVRLDTGGGAEGDGRMGGAPSSGSVRDGRSPKGS
jgi:hypothetical protein